MELYRGEWIALLLNVIVLASCLAIPALGGLLAFRGLRRGISEDRRRFEDQIRAKLDQTEESQAEIMRRLDDLVRG